jgi:hypothetical protein
MPYTLVQSPKRSTRANNGGADPTLSPSSASGKRKPKAKSAITQQIITVSDLRKARALSKQADQNASPPGHQGLQLITKKLISKLF